MNKLYEPQAKKHSKRTFFAILIIAAGLHLLILFPLMSTHLAFPTFENALLKDTDKTQLNIRLIPKEDKIEPPIIKATQAVESRQQSFPINNGGELNLETNPPLSIKEPNTPFSIKEPNEQRFNLDTQLMDEVIKQNSTNTSDSTNAETDSASLSKSLESTQTQSFEQALENPDSDQADIEEVFSGLTKQQLQHAEVAQAQYEAAQKEEINYAITEDSDGTRYVNIKGICWRIPPPGSEEAWMIVYAGCSGQTKTFNIEINIGMDILGPDSPLSIDK